MRARLPLFLALLLTTGGLAYRLGGYPLLEPDEGRNAEIAREMAATNDYVLPHLNGLPYLDKPVLYFATGAVAQEIFGATEVAARLPSLLFTLLTAGLLAWFARRLYGPDAAALATVVYLASPFTLAYARTVIFDSAVGLFVLAAIAALFLAAEAPVRPASADTPIRPSAGGWWAVGGWAAIALGVLTKGPVALALPLMVVVPYAAWRRRLMAVLDPAAILVFLALVLPWVFAVSRTVPDFLRYALVVETAQRLTTPALQRTGPWWYFFPILLGAAFPWTIAALARRPSVVRGWGADPRAVLLGLWIVVPLVFFSFSQSKRPQYILPLVPAVALAVAHHWRDARARRSGTRVAGAALAVAGAALLLAAGRLASLFTTGPDVAAAIPGVARGLGTVALVGGAAAVGFGARPWALPFLALPAAAIPLVGMPLLQAVGAERSSAALAAALRPALTEQTEVVAIGTYPLSLPFYLRRTLTVASADGHELTSNYVTRHLEAMRAAPGSTLRAPDWWLEAVAICDRPRLFLAPLDAGAVRERLRTALPLLATSQRVAAYGPCGVANLARRD